MIFQMKTRYGMVKGWGWGKVTNAWQNKWFQLWNPWKLYGFLKEKKKAYLSFLFTWHIISYNTTPWFSRNWTWKKISKGASFKLFWTIISQYSMFKYMVTCRNNSNRLTNNNSFHILCFNWQHTENDLS